MDLGPKIPNNEFVENGLENLVLINQTNLRMDSDLERKKKKRVCVGINRPRKDLKRSVLIYYFQFIYKFSSSSFHCFFFLFILSSTLVPTSHMYTGGLVLILVPSSPSINLHVVVVRLKHTVQVSPPY